MEFVLIEYLGGYDGEGKMHMLIVVKEHVKVEVFTISCINFAYRVKLLELKRSFY